MMLKFLPLVSGVVLATLANAQHSGNSQIQFEEVAGLREFTGEMMVRPMQIHDLLAQGYSQNQAELLRLSAAERLHGLVLELMAPIDVYVISLPSGVDENTMAADLMASGMYEYAHPNWMTYPINTVPNDPQFNSQWWHSNIHSTGGWDYGTGTTNVIAAVCDTGIDSDHPDLAAHLIPGYNSADRLTEAQGGSTEDINGHGTNCAGCVGAIGNNNNQVVGVCWSVSIMPVRVTNSSTGGAVLDDLIDGALWAAQNDAGSASVSYTAVESPVVGTAGTTMKNSYDCLLLWAAGNGNYQLDPGTDWVDTIIVAATDQNNDRAGFSNRGKPIDIAAPGVSILTTAMGGGTSSPSGTSFSTPIASGLCALVRATHPGLSAQEIEDLIFDNAQDIGPRFQFGKGLVDVEATMIAASYDLRLDLGGPLTSGSTVSATISGSSPAAVCFVYNGTGPGSTTIPGIGTLEIANGRIVAQGTANAAGIASINRFLPAQLSGRTVNLQCIDDLGSTSAVHVETIL
jgi:subtilisin family serine protease